MKKIKYLIFILMLFPTIVLANSDYKITSCDTEVTVDNNYNINVTEAINFAFNNDDVLVTKEIPYTAKNLKIDKKYFLEITDTKLIKIFSDGYKNNLYNIKYSLESDKKNTYIIPLCNNYNNEINNIDFHINLPSSFSKENVRFLLNNEEITDISYEITNNTLIGTYKKLSEDSILNVEVNYNNIYFNNYNAICIIIPIIFAIISFLLWYFYGKDLKYTITKISKLPNTINLLNIALVNDGIVTNEEAYYLLLDLANRGYLTIKESRNHQFTIIRGKDYDGKDYIEASFLKALFRKTIKVSISEYIDALSTGKKSNAKELVNTIPDNSIKDHFKRACNDILGLINTNEEKNKYFEEKSDAKRMYLIAMIAIILVLVTSLPFIKINKLYFLPISVIISVVTLYILINFISSLDFNKKSNKITSSLIIVLITIIVLLLPSFKHNRLYMISFLVSIICVGIILFFYKYMPKRTIYGTKIYSKIEGFKVYLEEITYDKIMKELKENPNYLLDILSPSLILGCGDIVIKQIKNHEVKEPSWYIIEDGYTPIKFNNSLNRLKYKLNYQKEEK